MADVIGQMVVQLAADTAKFRTDLATVQRQLEMLAAAGQKVDGGLKQAGKALDDAGRPLNDVSKTSENTSKTFYELTHRSRLLSEQLLSELNPALSSVVTATTMAARGFQGF